MTRVSDIRLGSNNKFEALYNLPEDVEEAWKTTLKSYTDAAEETLGFGKRAKQQGHLRKPGIL